MTAPHETPGGGWRADIDGLRAVAVLGVLLYHAGAGFPGGYVGVDVFFVLSGFLITRLIQTRMEAGSFSFKDFYKRRVLRILPAQCVMALSVFAVGLWVLLPEDVVAMGNSLVAQSVMLANNHFHAQSGYFDTHSEYKPLLHTWSLSVEEQYYLLYPLLLLVLNRRLGRRARLVVLAALGVLSLGVSAWWLRTDPPASFFLLPSRAWELILGGLVSQLPRGTPSPRVGSTAALLGLAMILTAMLSFGHGTPFPGVNALLPCVGTALVLWGNTTPQAVQRLLSVRPAVFVGKISYSLYLWHWPLLVLGRYSEPLPRDALGSAPWLLAAFVLAWLSYVFVEEPFRHGLPRLGARRKVVLLVSTNVALVVCGLLFGKATHDEGVRRRLGPEQSLAHSRAKLLLWGDSHASTLEDVLGSMCESYAIDGWRATRGGVAPILNAWRNQPPWPDTYRKHNSAVLELLDEHEFTHVLLAARWAWNVYEKELEGTKGLLLDAEHSTLDEPTAREVFAVRMRETVDLLRERGIEVWVLRQVPRQPVDVGREFALAEQRGEAYFHPGVPVADHHAFQAPVTRVLDSLAGPGVHLLDPLEHLPVRDGRVLPVLDGASLYKDDNHLSPVGAERLRPLFVPLFESMRELGSAASPP